MKKPILLLSSLLLISPMIASADMDIRGERTSFFERNKPKEFGHNYTYLEGTYLRKTLDANNTEETIQGGGLKISIEFEDSFAGYLDVTGGAIVVSNNKVGTSDINVGAIYYYPHSESLDLLATLESNSISYTDPTSNTSASVSGYTFLLGIKHQIDEEMAWGISTGVKSIDDVSANNSELEFLYGSRENVQYVGKYNVSNADDNAKSLILGLRINY